MNEEKFQKEIEKANAEIAEKTEMLDHDLKMFKDFVQRSSKDSILKFAPGYLEDIQWLTYEITKLRERRSMLVSLM